MGLISRMSTIIKAKVNDLLDRAEDPRVTLDYSYEKQLEHLQNVKRGIVEVVASRRRLELQAARLQDNVAKLEGQAKQAVAAGRDDLARLALQRKQAAQLQLGGLDGQIAGLEEQQQKLIATEQRLMAKVESFRTQKEVIKAQFSAAEAQVKIGESLTGISEEMADVSMAIDRAREKTESLQARASAIDELVAAGTLEDITGGEDAVERELSRMTVDQNVDLELKQMKRNLGVVGPAEPKRLEEGR